ncbi:MAG: CsbD family protein [Devosia sp.]|nr:CsbD family protein [Devosia sp.]
MDKDRIKGSIKQPVGGAKVAVAKLAGDKKLQVEGEADPAEGKVQNAVGGLKDTIRGAIK